LVLLEAKVAEPLGEDAGDWDSIGVAVYSVYCK
jgi:hypothetical protein